MKGHGARVSHAKCIGNQEPMLGAPSLFPPNPGSHTFTGQCVWVWFHPAAEVFFVTKCAPTMQLVALVTVHMGQ